MFKLLLFAICAGVIGFAAWDYMKSGGTSNSTLVQKDLYPLDLEIVRGPKPRAGEPTLLEFWATWCGPCKQTIPHLNKLSTQYRKRMNVIGVTNEGRAKVLQFMQRTPMQYTVATDPGQRYASALGVTSIPRAFFLDGSGKVLWSGHPGKLDAGQIEELLKRAESRRAAVAAD